jgi:dipeptidyl-peptidase-4
MDATRIGVYGKSFGGYFSVLAALRHPEVYRAAVAIAPVTDWRNYDTAYTERYLGIPEDNTGVYDMESAIVAARAPRTPGNDATILVAHGTADDNVYFFNSLSLVEELAKASRPVTFLPFLGQTHQIASADANVAIYLAAATTFQAAFGTGVRVAP